MFLNVLEYNLLGLILKILLLTLEFADLLSVIYTVHTLYNTHNKLYKKDYQDIELVWSFYKKKSYVRFDIKILSVNAKF